MCLHSLDSTSQVLLFRCCKHIAIPVQVSQVLSFSLNSSTLKKLYINDNKLKTTQPLSFSILPQHNFFYFLIYHLPAETKIPTITKFVSCYAVIYCIEIKYNVQKNMIHILRQKVLCLQKKGGTT